MRRLHADLHVHIGRAGGCPVKVTASGQLTLAAVLSESMLRKGLAVVGLADCLSLPVLSELRRAVRDGQLTPVQGGGLAFSAPPAHAAQSPAGLLVVPGCEVELLVWGAPVHFLIYLPGIEECLALRGILSRHILNVDLGCQRAHGIAPTELSALAHGLGAVCGLAHAFTPHRGYFGSTGRPLAALPGRGRGTDQGRSRRRGPGEVVVDFVEMGLSADTALASLLPELDGLPLLASSDAHGAGAIAREVTELALEQASFGELVRALAGEGGRGITAYYGLDPRLGKYYRTACRACGFAAGAGDPAVLACPACGEARRVVPGVLDRILTLAAGLPSGLAPAPGSGGRPSTPGTAHRHERPPYHHHVPLSFLPGVGQATRGRLLDRFGSEIEVLHHIAASELAQAAGERAAAVILAARRGELAVTAGGGGAFGRVAASRQGRT